MGTGRTNAFEAWPGEAMEPLGESGWYYAYAPDFVQNAIVSANGGTVQTEGAAIEAGKADSTIGGPWMVPSAREAGISLGIAPMPVVDETGLKLAPYSGVQGAHALKFAAENKEDSVRAVLAALAEPEIGVTLALSQAQNLIANMQ